MSRGEVLASAIAAREQDERRQAVRVLLQTPVVTLHRTDAEVFGYIRLHSKQLVTWFDRFLGYRLIVEPHIARLIRPQYRLLPPDRPASTMSGAPFTRRRYVLFCLILAAVDGPPISITLSDLGQRVRDLCAGLTDVEPYDAEQYVERRALVDAVRLAVAAGVLRFQEGDERGYIDKGGTGIANNALYITDDRALAHALTLGLPISAFESLEELLTASAPLSRTDDEARHRRHRVYRLLIDEPVVYLDDLSADEIDYLKTQRAHITQQLEDWCGLHLEMRLEGAAAIDPEGKLSDVRFPGQGMVPHAALIICDHLRDLHHQSGGGAVASWPRVAAWVATAMVRFADRWRTYAERPSGAEDMARDAVDLLARMRLVRIIDEGIVPLPAVARYAAAAPPLLETMA
jgi:uncharacterized protein (TIGR02678 family)